jgi:hypothetical protein
MARIAQMGADALTAKERKEREGLLDFGRGGYSVTISVGNCPSKNRCYEQKKSMESF